MGKRQSKLGSDPLAWDDEPEETVEQGQLPLDIELLEETFGLLAPRAGELATQFYDELFARYPEVKPMFAGTDRAEQERKLISALTLTVNNLRKPELLQQALVGLGAKHESYGAMPEHYQAVASTMLDVMKNLAGRKWTKRVNQAWSDAFALVAEVMISGYENNETDRRMNVISGANSGAAQVGNIVLDDIEVVKNILEHAPVNIMIADAEENVIFVNKKAREVLTSLEDQLAEYLPGFKVANVMGGSIHRYHKDPGVIKNILKTLHSGKTHVGEIRPGHFIFEHETRALFDVKGNVAGYVVQWNDVTDLRRKADETFKLQRAVDKAQTAMMMIDRDLVITYVNSQTRDLLGSHAQALASIYPGFKPENIVGTCIDIFHRNPAHQRRLLDDPTNLPYETDIQVGPLLFHIRVNAINDLDGRYIGCTLEWDDVTEKRAKEEEAHRLQRAVENAQVAMMTIDRDLTVTYINQETRNLMTKHRDALMSLYPGFKPEELVGTCIDIFHKNPSHQRRLLDDPRNLPYETDIQVGPLTFHIRAAAINDLAGNYIGNTLEWSDVTELRVKETDVARLMSAVEGSTTAMMMCDLDANITYCNPSVVNLLAKHQSKLRTLFPNFDVNKLIGQNIDQFHKNPRHQRALFADISRLPYETEIEVGGLEFRLTLTAISDANGNHMGNTVEWREITEEMDAQRQVEKLISEAVEGELDSRIDTSRYDGFMKNLGDGVNRMMDAVVAPLKASTAVLSRMAEGDLSRHMDGEYKGEFAVLCNAINSTVDNLQSIVNQVRETTGSIASASSEIAQGNTDLSQRTEEQASSLEETASSMEELTSTVKQNADNARQANQLATDARTHAEKGGDVVGRAVDAMGAINQSSKKISDIIGVIDEIAFQTNLLALNAAVEAARAGEQGRGFAVVATEVRNLAQRSAAAAKEIKALINDSVDKVDDGTRLVDESGKTLQEIVTAVKKVSDIISEIAAASQEQSAGIDQVNKAVSQMDEVTQQNAALVEEAAAASEALDDQAKQLEELMEFFDVGADSNAVASKRSASGRQEKRQSSTNPAKGRAERKPVRKPESGDDWDEF